MRLVFGGTFDPVHLGHLRMANELVELLALDKIYLMPCGEAVHKQSVGASSLHRLNMLMLASEGDLSIAVDERELFQGQASYTIESLLDVRKEIGDESLCLVMGADAAAGLSSWLRVDEFSKLTNILVMDRPGKSSFSKSADSYVKSLEALGYTHAKSLNELKSTVAGTFFCVNLTVLDISSTLIRNGIKQDLSIRYLVTDAVRKYICDNNLYQN